MCSALLLSGAECYTNLFGLQRRYVGMSVFEKELGTNGIHPPFLSLLAQFNDISIQPTLLDHGFATPDFALPNLVSLQDIPCMEVVSTITPSVKCRSSKLCICVFRLYL